MACQGVRKRWSQRTAEALSFQLAIFLICWFAGQLGSQLLHYETLDYDMASVNEEHGRVKRETTGFFEHVGEPLKIYFHAHDK